MTLLQIVPRLPPAVDGLGDYALNLARQLRQSFGLNSSFLVADPHWVGGREIEGFPVRTVTSRSSGALLSDLLSFESPVAMLLHYVGYGYAKRGAPLWLVAGLEDWRANNCSAPLLTMFHEVYASGPFWTSSFWLSPPQKHLAGRLARLSDACLTSRIRYAEILRRLIPDGRRLITTLPVFSNIGEPVGFPSRLTERKRRMIVFGGSGSRQRVYEKSIAAVEEVCRAWCIEEILDVGPPTNSPIVSRIGKIPVVQTGARPALEVSSLMSDSIVGFFDYHRSYLAKSTIFAAYCAHRLILMSADRKSSASVEDGLEAGKHFWIADANTKDLDLCKGQILADNAYAWYQNHSLSVHATAYVTNVKALAARTSSGN